MNRPLLLLLITGAALGCNFPLGRLATAAGVNPALWAAMISLGAGSVMLVLSRLAEGPGHVAPVARFAMISGLISYVVPNFLTFAAIAHIGSGLAAIMFAMSPVVTALLSIVLKVRPPSPLGLAGIVLGLAGAVIIVVARQAGIATEQSLWLFLAVLIPVALGLGNVYRTLGWPPGVGPMRLASLTNLAAVLPLLGVAAVFGGIDLAPLAAVPGLAAAQLAASCIMFTTFFRLQQVGGPTYLSQIGYVGAVIGVGIGVAVFRETYPAAVWLGAAVVAAGIALTTVAQIGQRRG